MKNYMVNYMVINVESQKKHIIPINHPYNSPINSQKHRTIYLKNTEQFTSKTPIRLHDS